MTWHEWRQNDLPCAFSHERARENYTYIEKLIGPRFFRSKRPSTTNAFLKKWHTTGAGAFLEINALAEDLRLIESKRGMSFIVRDLCDDRLCLPTWHTIHSAALFERARVGAVLEFVDAGNEEAPDFIVDIDGDRIPVEAKLLTRSKEELLFVSVARRIEEALGDANQLTPVESKILVILKRPIANDVSKEAIEFCREAISRYRGTAISARGSICNVFIEPAKSPEGLSEYRVRYIMAPVPEDENIRVLQRAKKASKQLRSWPSTRDAGILSVGLSDYQDAVSVFTHISDRVRRGRFGGISAVLLIKRRIHMAPPIRTTLDLLELRKNENAVHPLSGKVPLRPLGAAALLTKVEPYIGGIRSYRFGVALGRVVDPKKAALILPDIRVLTTDMIA